MANRVIITNLFRASYVHLAEKYAMQAGKDPKFSVEALIPKSGQHQLAQVAHPLNCNPQPILQAIIEVVKDEFHWDMPQDIFQNPAKVIEYGKMVGVQFPPTFKDGDQSFEKDQNGNPIPGKVNPNHAGMWRLNITSDDVVGTCDPHGNNIAPKSIYSGAWVRAQIEVSAYVQKTSGARIINIDLCNVQMAYDDANLGGSMVRQDASTAFAGQDISDSNVPAGFGQTGPMGAMPTTPTIPGVPATPTAPVQTVKKYVHTDTQFTKEQYINASPAWTDDALVNAGKGKWVEEPVAPAIPNAPAMPAAPAAPAAPVAPAAPAMPAAPVAPAAPAAPVAAPSIPAAPAATATVTCTDPVILSDALRAQGVTYQDMINQGWTNETMVENGHGTLNYLA